MGKKHGFSLMGKVWDEILEIVWEGFCSSGKSVGDIFLFKWEDYSVGLYCSGKNIGFCPSKEKCERLLF